MHALPWEDASFDVVTSFRGIWGTTPDALAEVRRVLVPGGRMGLTVWGHIKASPGAWALKPFTLATEPKVANQAAMVALGRPGCRRGAAGPVRLRRRRARRDPVRLGVRRPRGLRPRAGVDRAGVRGDPGRRRGGVPCSTPIDLARERVRDGLPLRAEIKVVGYLARKPRSHARGRRQRPSFLRGAGARRRRCSESYDDDIDELGYVMNASRLWAHAPGRARACCSS